MVQSSEEVRNNRQLGKNVSPFATGRTGATSRSAEGCRLACTTPNSAYLAKDTTHSQLIPVLPSARNRRISRDRIHLENQNHRTIRVDVGEDRTTPAIPPVGVHLT